MIKRLINNMMSQRSADRKADLMRSLIRREAQMGGTLFGPVHPGGRREFFCLDEHTWVWHEEWIDETGNRRIETTRYEVRSDRVVKVQQGQYKELSLQEAVNLRSAIAQYQNHVNNSLYKFV